MSIKEKHSVSDLKMIDNFFFSKITQIIVSADVCSLCHRLAECIDHHCVCKRGYVGNGNYCKSKCGVEKAIYACSKLTRCIWFGSREGLGQLISVMAVHTTYFVRFTLHWKIPQAKANTKTFWNGKWRRWKNSWGDPVSSFHFIKWNQNGFIFNYVYYPSIIAQKPRFTPLWNFPVTNKIVDSSKWFDR